MAHTLLDLLNGLDDDVRIHDGLTVCEPHCLIRALMDEGFQDEARYRLEPHRIVRLDAQGRPESPALYTVDRYPDAKEVQKSVLDLLEAMSDEQRNACAALHGPAFGSYENIRAFIEDYAEDGDDAETIAERYVTVAHSSP